MARTYREVHQYIGKTDTDVDSYSTTVATRVVTLIGGIIISLLGLRFILSLLGANRGNGFADFIYTTSRPFVSPFFGLFNYQPRFGVSRFEFETLIAILVYGLLTALIVWVINISRRPSDFVE